MEYVVKVIGFETEEQAKCFIDWFEGQGEQDAAYWFEEHETDGKSPLCRSKTGANEWNELTMTVKMT